MLTSCPVNIGPESENFKARYIDVALFMTLQTGVIDRVDIKAVSYKSPRFLHQSSRDQACCTPAFHSSCDWVWAQRRQGGLEQRQCLEEHGEAFMGKAC